MATAELTLVPTESEIQAWRMPSPEVGEPVRWYPHAIIDAKAPLLGWIARVSHRSVVIRLAAGDVKDSVPHVDDPRMRVNANRREFGSWDYTEAHYRYDREIEALKRRVAALESMAPADDAKEPDEVPRESGVEDYHALRRRAKEMGIEFTQNPPRDWLTEQIALKQAQQ